MVFYIPISDLYPVQRSFLDQLFEFRRIFHSLAAAVDHADDDVAVVCWVDHIFAKLGGVSLALLGHREGPSDHVKTDLRSIAKHRHESALHAASQLPRELLFVSVMRSTSIPRR
jgi:hypothetical protein